MKTSSFKWVLVSLFFFGIQSILSDCFAQQNNPKDGMFKVFYDSKLQALANADSNNANYYRVINYRNGKIYGAVTDYYKSGHPLMIGYYANNNAGRGNENGQFTWYYENGTIFQTCNYVNGALDGAYKEFYPSGAKKSCVSYAMGNRNGCEYSWDEDGKPSVYNGNSENCPCAVIAKENLSKLDSNSIANKAMYYTPTISTGSSDHIGHYENTFSNGDYTIINRTLLYKSNSAVVKEVSFGGATEDSKPGDLKVNSNGVLSTFITIDGFKRIGGRYSYTYSLCITFENGKVHQENKNIENYNLNDPFLFEFDYKAPSLKAGVASLVLYSNFTIHDKFSDAVIQGFYKFTLLQ